MKAVRAKKGGKGRLFLQFFEASLIGPHSASPGLVEAGETVFFEGLAASLKEFA